MLILMNDYQEKIQFVAISLVINNLKALILLVIIRIRKLVGKTKCNFFKWEASAIL
jgi:hypothetical protein